MNLEKYISQVYLDLYEAMKDEEDDYLLRKVTFLMDVLDEVRLDVLLHNNKGN